MTEMAAGVLQTTEDKFMALKDQKIETWWNGKVVNENDNRTYDKKGDVKNGSSKLESSKTEIAKK
jgi:hypothetical protein